jgi:hypothetical protein
VTNFAALWQSCLAPCGLGEKVKAKESGRFFAKNDAKTFALLGLWQ